MFVPRAVTPIVRDTARSRGLVLWKRARSGLNGGLFWPDLAHAREASLVGFTSPTSTLGWGPTWRSGGEAELRFDGAANAYAETLNSAGGLLNLNQTLTMAWWFRPSSLVNTYNALIEWNNGTTYGVQVFVLGAGHSRPNTVMVDFLDTSAGEHSYTTPNNSIAASLSSEGYFLTITRSGATVAAYINGAVQTLTALGGTAVGTATLQTTYNLELGIRKAGDVNPGYRFIGAMDDVRMSDRAIDAGEAWDWYLQHKLGWPEELGDQPSGAQVLQARKSLPPSRRTMYFWRRAA